MMMTEAEIKEQLMSSNPEFRHMVQVHHQYEGKIVALNNLHHMTEQDYLDEVQLKKKKLHLKDQMNSMLEKFRSGLSHQAT
jgi:uncharacterized protein YdcH (DUF465 family)